MRKRLPKPKTPQQCPELWVTALDVWETRSLAPTLRKSYLLSKFWLWIRQIQIHPHVNVPAPRFLTRHDV
jgi:hypothetical protein